MPDDAAVEHDSVRLTDRIGIGVLTRLIPRDLVDEVLIETGRVEQRRRLLPARVVVYYVLALNLFFSDAYEEVMRKLVGGLQFLGSWERTWTVPTASALCQARKRLGSAPLEMLFGRVAQPMIGPGSGRGMFRSMRVMAVDGVHLDLPDTPDNAAEFGRSGNMSGSGPFPQARIVALAECGSRAIVAAVIGGCHAGERELASQLIGHVNADTLVLADRGFYSYDFWKDVRTSGAQLLWRMSTHILLPVSQMLPDGSYLSALAPKSMRSAIAQGKKRRIERYEVPVRVIDYTVDNRATPESGEPEVIRLVTSLLDHELAPAAELAALYYERWEIELAFDEIETHQMGRPRVLRSRSPEMVRQEIWSLLLTHYAIRHLMHQAADSSPDYDLDRISFMRSLRIARRQVTDQAAFSPLNPDHGHPSSTD